MARAYYNEFDPYAAAWLRNLIAAGHLPPGDVDERSIVDVAPSDLAEYTQCHFFAGIGGWALAARLAGWPDCRELWTGSPPCQPFSVAGAQRGADDERHLWPDLFRLIRARRPAVVMGEQVAAAVGANWLDGVHADLEGIGYACRAVVVPACAVDAPHRRDRLWFVAHASGEGWRQAGCAPSGNRQAHSGRSRDRPSDAGAARNSSGIVADPYGERGQIDPHAGWGAPGSGTGEVTGPRGARDGDVADADGAGCEPGRWHDPSDGYGHPATAASHAVGNRRSAWAHAGWIIGHDGKARRVEPGIPLLAHGVHNRVGRLRAYGNAIVPQVAAEVIGAYLDAERAA